MRFKTTAEGEGMIRVDLGSDGLARTRFAFSRLQAASELLFMLGHHRDQLSRQWGGPASNALRTHRLELLATLTGGAACCLWPDFAGAAPDAASSDLEAELHRLATTSPGERQVAEQFTAQLEQFWTVVLAPHWPRIRARLEADIAHKADKIAREGFGHTIDELGSTLNWRQGGLDIDLPSRDGRIAADAVIFTPTVFLHRTMYDIHPGNIGAPRTPLITYPALASASAPGPPLTELIGTTRALLLAELTGPRTTSELAELLHLSPATISYHLQVLHRAGLLHRTRQSRQVLYQKARRPTREAA